MMPPIHSPSSRGFSLLELLTVMAIIAILGALVVFSPSLLRSNDLTTGSNLVMEDMAYARELASSGNQPTEVWFLRSTGGKAITALQIYTIDQSGNPALYGGVHHLPASIGADSGTLSPLFASSNKKQWTGTQVQPSIAGYGTGYDAWYVRFMPDGATTLPTTTYWYVTLHDIGLGDQLTALPPNYAVVGLDPVTGAVTLYRP